MAWNPTPEVAAVRDAARKIEAKMGETVDRAFVVFTTEGGRIGYASYGNNQATCALAKRLADTAYEAVMEQFERTEMQHHKYDLSALNPDVDLAALAMGVADRVACLRLAIDALGEDSEAKRLAMRDLVLPAVELLARFDACVQVSDEDADGTAARVFGIHRATASQGN